MIMLGDTNGTGGMKADCSSASFPLCSIDNALSCSLGSGHDDASAISVVVENGVDQQVT
jgi:hypothetical protein